MRGMPPSRQLQGKRPIKSTCAVTGKTAGSRAAWRRVIPSLSLAVRQLIRVAKSPQALPAPPPSYASWRCSEFGVDEAEKLTAAHAHLLVIGRSSPPHAVGIIRGAEAVASNPIMVDHDADEQVPVDDLTPEEASRIIHSHRKVRYGKPESSDIDMSRSSWRL